MKHVLAQDFAQMAAITTRAAQQAFSRALSGKSWRGLYLPVVTITGQRGGLGGVAMPLTRKRPARDLRARLNLPSLPVEALVDRPVEAPGNLSARLTPGA